MASAGEAELDEHEELLSAIERRLTLRDGHGHDDDMGDEEEVGEDYDPVAWRQRMVDKVQALAALGGDARPPGESGGEVEGGLLLLSVEDVDEEIHRKWREWPWSSDWEWGALQVRQAGHQPPAVTRPVGRLSAAAHLPLPPAAVPAACGAGGGKGCPEPLKEGVRAMMGDR